MNSTPITPLERSADEELRVSDLRKSFPSRTGERLEVLRGITFSISAGEVIAVTGASGAGKSTLLHVLGGLEAPDHGAIQRGPIRGAEPPTPQTAGNSSNGPQCQVGFVFQFHHLLPDLNALENVALPLMIARLSRLESDCRAGRCLEEMGLGSRLNERIGDLSGGEQQRVAVARALVGNPGLVLADEPTGNLDSSIADEIGQLLIEYCRRRRAIVVIATHNEQLAQLCDRVLLLQEGRLIDR